MRHPPIQTLFIITGTTRGIGKALVESALALPGSAVVSLSRAASAIRANHQTIRIDLNHVGRIAAAFTRIRVAGEQTAGLTHTVLINNAGVLDPIAPVVDCDDALLAGNIQVNLTAPLILSRHFYHFSKHFPGRKWIVNVTSGASRSPYYGWSAYGAAKAGIDMATRAMAQEFATIDRAFSVCAVAPGTVDTRMQEQIRRCTPARFQAVAKFHALKAGGGLAPPDHVAATLIRLLMEGRFENGGRYDLREMAQTERNA